jgi:hypothetical protein
VAAVTTIVVDFIVVAENERAKQDGNNVDLMPMISKSRLAANDAVKE